MMVPVTGGDETQHESWMNWHLPVVTERDLTAFHTRHFGNGSLPSQFFIQSEPAFEYEEYEEDYDGLGYYLDGVKRTLTDDQIAMFRHSEIQALIKEKDAAEHEEGNLPDRTSDITPIFARKDFQHNCLQPSRAKKKKSRPRKAREKRKLAVASMEQAKRRRNSSSEVEEPRKKQFLKDDQQDPEDFLSDGDEKTYRRKAREADEIKETSVELDY
ncbi:hypothetical protein E2P81_ATG11820 [Venturia nashicola]|uniref:Uncharacterized protein n=1 Tax=Venturia nashicola TaxID=86259 RepID=A0A4Z1NSY5_9PEZI|nr:hypothetical protein E6O75_ATG11510 [Venturia nashicola]TLD24484.1 hypothetical protein E2P81_ATG11820 [Venturia nashicola]